MNDYERVARVIRYLDQHHTEQPNLTELAAHSGLSRFHFHRLFSHWAGITPKDFLQCLTLVHARQQLQSGKSVLDAALDSGLSSPGRLHDLCVKLESASPGEIKAGGEGWRIEAGFADSPFGLCCVGLGPRGVCYLVFVESADRQQAIAPLSRAWPRARVRWDNAAIRPIAAQIFSRGPISPSATSLRAYVRATPFQLRVWQALLRVPAGGVTTYGRLAAAVGQPAAARAVGTAVGSNPVAFLIPCHRVIRQSGVLGQYRWGPERKRIMLGWESGRPSAGPHAQVATA